MTTFAKNTGKTIQRAFDEFNKNNPSVYVEFKRLVKKALLHKKTKVSAKLIINVIRWEKYLETTEHTLFTDYNGAQHKFRINDAYHSRYARLYIEEHPEHANLFNSRRLRSP